MAISATMSVWGMYQINPTLFDGLSVPNGVDKENVKDNILLESESLEVLYSNPDFLKAAITVWSAERLSIWEKLYATTRYEYNPIENYDRYEEGTNRASGTSSGENSATTSGKNSATTSGENSTTTSGQNSKTSSGENSTTSSGQNSTTSSGENESVTSNTAYDSNTFADSAKTESSGSNSTSATNSSTESGTSSSTESGTSSSTESGKSSTTESGTSSSTESGTSSSTASSNGSNEYENSGSFTTHIHGNIGVRSSQELIEQERKVATFCITSYIVEEFIDKFCIGVY